jgi:hypothetical protein
MTERCVQVRRSDKDAVDALHFADRLEVVERLRVSTCTSTQISSCAFFA